MIYYQLFTCKAGSLGQYSTEVLSLGPDSCEVDKHTHAHWKSLDGQPLALGSDVFWLYVEVEDTSL